MKKRGARDYDEMRFFDNENCVMYRGNKCLSKLN